MNLQPLNRIRLGADVNDSHVYALHQKMAILYKHTHRWRDVIGNRSRWITANFLHIKSYASYLQYTSKPGLWSVAIRIEERKLCGFKKLNTARTESRAWMINNKNQAFEGNRRGRGRQYLWVTSRYHLWMFLFALQDQWSPLTQLVCKKKRSTTNVNIIYYYVVKILFFPQCNS